MTMFKVYWTDRDGVSTGEVFDDMIVALNLTQRLRNEGFRFISMVTENVDQVGRMGVDAVIDGKLPDGSEYTWKKRRI